MSTETTDTRDFAPICAACGAEHNGPEVAEMCVRCYAADVFRNGDVDSIDEVIWFVRDASGEPVAEPYARAIAEIGHSLGYV